MSTDTRDPGPRSIGILGKGRVGSAIAALARAGGFEVAAAASQDPIDDVLACDAVVLAIPLGKFRDLPAERLRGALVIDAMNYWWELDGDLPEFSDATTSSSEVVARHLRGARVVKAFNHLSAYALENLARPAGDEERLAVAVAADDPGDRASVAVVIDRCGFDAVDAGALAEGVRFEPHTELFGADADAVEAQDMLERFWDTQRGRVVARARGGSG